MTEQDQAAVDELMLKHYGARRAAVTTNGQWHRTGGDDRRLAGKGCWVCAYANTFPEDLGCEPALYMVHWSNFFGEPATVVYRALPLTEQPTRA